ncbi:ABC transporter substrate-binding protein [Arthrobacter sp. CJ23]|uniref:ABC transporter substrate-binding protein n=1 Tax=Arthrobacter sp. CJ23 TaxID=2972479 RepID=UPI00215CBAE6|nr:extracellular solute-binding protein [Arthrobacter sp. CJ23]UVJ39234.1 extracellular solute-binding protein [Arthrobacter sp. CJ23]
MLAVAGLLATAGCTAGGNDGPSSGSGEKTTLTVWSWSPEFEKQYATIWHAFEATNPDIEIDFRTYVASEYNQVLATGLTGSEGPDVVQLKSYGGLQAVVDGGNLMPISGKVDGLDALAEDVVAGLTARSDGEVYGVPLSVQTMQVYYNAEIFEENHLEEPKSWADLIKISKELKEAGIIPISIGGADTQVGVPVGTEVFSSSRYGGSEFASEVLAGTTDFTDPDYVASLELMQELQPYLPDNVAGISTADSQALFLSGQAAMYPSLTAAAGLFGHQNPDLKLGVFPAPVGKGWASSAALTPGFVDGGYGISSRTEHPDEAKRLLSWMTTVEFGQLVADELVQLNPVPGVEISDPLLKEMLDNYAANPAPYLMLTDFRYGQPWGSDLVGKNIQALWLGSEDGEQAAKKIQDGLAAWFTPSS